MKKIFAFLSIVSIAFTATASGLLNENQAKSIALIRAQANLVNEDVNSVRSTGMAPTYSLVTIQYSEEAGAYNAIINRIASGQTCQYLIKISATTGTDDSQLPIKCE